MDETNQLIGSLWKDLNKKLAALNPHINHARNCTYNQNSDSPLTEFCTCELGQKKKLAREALKRLELKIGELSG